jgi:glycosyltransferase involved in cell wall biosynthesis
VKIKNIIIYYPSFERGGVEKILVNISKFFIEKKINVNLVTIKNKNNNFLKQSRYFKITNIVVKKNFIFNRYTTSLACLLPLIRVMKSKNNADTIVHSMQSNILAIIAAKIFSFKVVARNSEDAISSTKHAEEKVFSKIIFLIKFLFYHIADGIITNSKGSANSLNKFLINKSLVKYIYNPYLTKNKILLAKKNNYKKKDIILTVGRLCKQKNFKDLILAFEIFQKKYTNYQLHIIGNGYEKKMLLNIIKELKLEKKVFLMGWQSKVDANYHKAKLFVLPSVYEGLGNVLIDAINHSVPCIATNCKSGPKEILDNGKGGYIVPVKNISALSDKMIFAIKNKKITQEKVKFSKKRLFRFNSETQSKKYLNYLNSIL